MNKKQKPLVCLTGSCKAWNRGRCPGSRLPLNGGRFTIWLSTFHGNHRREEQKFFNIPFHLYMWATDHIDSLCSPIHAFSLMEICSLIQIFRLHHFLGKVWLFKFLGKCHDLFLLWLFAGKVVRCFGFRCWFCEQTLGQDAILQEPTAKVEGEEPKEMDREAAVALIWHDLICLAA